MQDAALIEISRGLQGALPVILAQALSSAASAARSPAPATS